MAKIIVYTRNGCPQCRMTKHFLESHQVDFEEHNINQEPQYIDYLKTQGFQMVPVVETPGHPAFSGFRPEQLRQLA